MVIAPYSSARTLDLVGSVGHRFQVWGRWLAALIGGPQCLQLHRTAQRSRADARRELLSLIRLGDAQVPPDGGWVAGADFLLLLARQVLTQKPGLVVEFGSGVSSVVIAACLQLNGKGRLLSFDHDEGFAELTRRRLRRAGLTAEVQAAPLRPGLAGYGGSWYGHGELPDGIDLLVIDGPQAWRQGQEESRGSAAPAAFAKLAPGAVVLLDDASRDGEQRVAARWRAEFPEISFGAAETQKGVLIGTRAG
ncbi:MAG: class I SAM-dependent methyltransferase [Sphingomonadaceae bacterium]|nr:class I SAM-dependent methyltransferase [Sphingomonadaceae bacterium]